MSVSAEAMLSTTRWRRIKTMNPTGYVGIAVLLALTIISVFESHLAPYGSDEQAGMSFLPPSLEYLLGTDDLGFDIFSSLIYGARSSMVIGIVSAMFGMLLAVGLGVIAGLYGGWIDRVIMRLADVTMVIPVLPLLIIVTAYSGPGLINIILMIGLVMAPRLARMVRSQVLSLRSRAYVEITTAFGARRSYAVFRHILPETLPIIFVGLINLTGRAIIMESGLAFLGLGDPSSKSWGMMLHNALLYPTTYLGSAWKWWVLPPSLCIGLLVVSVALVGYALEETIDPRLRQR